jgi:hypothetical protein
MTDDPCGLCLVAMVMKQQVAHASDLVRPPSVVDDRGSTRSVKGGDGDAAAGDVL